MANLARLRVGSLNRGFAGGALLNELPITLRAAGAEPKTAVYLATAIPAVSLLLTPGTEFTELETYRWFDDHDNTPLSSTTIISNRHTPIIGRPA